MAGGYVEEYDYQARQQFLSDSPWSHGELDRSIARVEEGSADFVITRRGRAVARIIRVEPEPVNRRHGIRERMRQTGQRHGPVAQEEAEFPEVWKARRGSGPDPLEETDEGGGV
jgi:antitoxin (DNA-binding transcriptional repressor) of toxin-antitoxin stability system